MWVLQVSQLYNLGRTFFRSRMIEPSVIFLFPDFKQKATNSILKPESIFANAQHDEV